MNASPVGCAAPVSPDGFRPRYRSHPKSAITTPMITTAGIVHCTAFMETPSASRAHRGRGRRVPLEHAGGAVRHDLAPARAHVGGVETHHRDRVRPHRGRVLHHAVECLAPGVLVELDVGPDL